MTSSVKANHTLDLYYKDLFRRADSNRDGRLQGEEAIEFLGRSKLSVNALELLWTLVDDAQRGYLDENQFILCMRAVGLAQNGRLPRTLAELTAHSDSAAYPAPRFDGVMPPVVAKAAKHNETKSKSATAANVTSTVARSRAQPAAASASSGKLSKNATVSANSASKVPAKTPVNALQQDHSFPSTVSFGTASTSSASSTLSSSSFPTNVSFDGTATGTAASIACAIGDDQLRQFVHFFHNGADENHDGYVDGATAKEYLSRSHLPTATLSQAWRLADQDSDGRLDLAEFCICMFLIRRVLDGYTLPSSLSGALHRDTVARKLSALNLR